MKSRVALPVSNRCGNVFIACLLAFSMTMLPFVQIAGAMSRTAGRTASGRSEASPQTTGTTEMRTSALPAAIPAAAPVPFAPVITATKIDALINDDGDLKADPTNGIPGTTEKIEYTVTISNTGTTDATNVVYSDTIDAHTTLVGGSITTQPIAVNDTFSAIGNVRIQVPDGASDLLGNDCDPDPAGGPCTNAGLSISVLAGDNSAPFSGTSSQGGQVTATSGNGSFEYNPAPGFEGSDTFTYTVTDGTGKTDTATVTITVSGMIWFVNAAAGGGGNGRLTNPFNCLVGAGCFSSTTADDPGDFIFLFSGTYNDNAVLVLLNNQKLIGAAATAPLAGPGSITGFTIPTFSDPLPATGGASPVITSTASGIQLASGNLLRGFTVGNTATTAGNYDILNTTTATVGTLNISEVILNGTGGLFRADSGGILNVNFPTATTTSAGSNGIHIAGSTSGSVSITGAGAISGVAGTDVVINGGTISFSCSSTITHAANSAMVDISNHTTGTVTFSATLSATNGTGLQFTNADSTYNFNGTNTLNGGDAGIDITGGSGGTFTFASGSSINNPSGIAYREDTSTASVTYNGTITKTNNANNGVDINAKTGGTTAFSGSITASTTTANAIDLTNTGGTVTFTGGLTLTTTSGIGFNASGSGATVNATQNNTSIVNTITSTTGTALNVTNSTIGASGITFRSISANGAPSGIVLNNTGTSGGLTITGDSGATVNGSGGTIQNTTSHGISLTTTRTISIDQISITNTLGDGINGSSVTDFNLTNSTIAGAGDGANEYGTFITNLFGTNTINNTSITNSQTNNLKISNNVNTAGTLTITNSTFTTTDATNGGDCVNVETGVGGSQQGNLTVSLPDNNDLNACQGDGIQAAGNDNSTLKITVDGSNSNYNNNLGSAVNIAGDGNAQIFALVQDLTMVRTGTTGSNGLNVINIQTIESVDNGPTLNATVQNNTIVSPGPGLQNASGIRVIQEGKGTVNANINNNNISGVAFAANGIIAQARAGNGTLNLTIGTGNTISLTSGVALDGVSVESGSSAGGDTNTVCLNMPSNNSAATGQQGYRLRVRAGTTFRLQDFVGNGSNQGDITTWVNTTKSNVGTTDIVTPAAWTAAPAPCTTATLPSAALFFTESQASNAPAKDATDSARTTENFAPATSNGVSIISKLVNAVTYFASEVHSLVEPTANAETARVEFNKEAMNGYPARTLQASANSHVASQKLPVSATENRSRKTLSHHAKIRTPRALLLPMAGETVSINIGTLRPGDSVTITFQVTVNNPPNLTGVPPGTPKVSNQGSVSFAEGPSVLTDDPAVGGGADPTDTPVDLFDTTTTLASNLNPSNTGDQVTFTATVAETPAQGSVDPTGTVDFIDTSNGNAVICNDVALAAGSAQCQLSSLTAGTHNIRADYSGDGNFDSSQSNVVAQVVNACTPNPIVTSTADSGAGSLRDAVANVCSGTTITFNLPGAGPHTITLTTGELAVAKNVTINNNSGESITVSGNNASRVFNINSGKTAAIIGLTISGGNNAGSGGGVLNDGTLTLVNSTLSGNHAGTDGGGISTSATAISLTLINTTISGNNANANGGGVAVLGGTMTSINSTITNNFADNDNNTTGTGGGIAASAGTTTLKNTIVAGNFNEDGASDAADDISGTVDPASSFNLIGTGGAGGLTNGVNNNQVGVAAGLGALASNGGLTQTHALLPTSLAIETGSNANLPTDTFDLDGDANTAETLPVDQRGTGFPRTADSADANTTQTVDIGAFELHPSIEDIANQSTNEDTVKNVTFNLGDDTGALIATVTATSSNTTLVPNANLVITGSGGSRNLQITPAAGQSGTTTITVTVTATNGRTAVDTFDLTVTGVNDPPSGTDNTVTTAEDTAYTFTAADFGFTDPNDTPPNSLLAVKITTLPGLGTLTNNNVAVIAGAFIPVADINGGLLKFTPVANGFGTPYTSFTFQVQDNGGGTDLDPTPNTMTINVTAINDPPSFTIAGNPPPVSQDAGPQTVLNFATSISAGPNEAGQTLTFNITPNGTTGTLTFSGTPAINSTTGTLTYTATNGTNGTATFNVTLSDNGSNTPPNSNTSGTQSFTITVNSPNASPVITTTAGNLAYTENAGAVAIDPGLTVTDADNTDLAGATVAITAGFVSAQDTLAFTNQLGITGSYNSGTGVLTLTGTTTVANYQTALRTVTYQNSSDNPTASRTITFTATDGISTPGTATRGIAITAVNDAPVNTVPGPQSTNEDTTKVFSSGNGNQISVADVDAGSNTIQVTLTATNGTLTLSTTAGLSFAFSDGNGTGAGDGTTDATMTFRGTLAAINTALNGMSFIPTTDFTGAASVQIISNDLGNTGTGGPLTDTDSVNITVNAANDAPVVTTTAGNLSYTENDPATAIDPGLTVTDVDSANLVGATVAITGNFSSAQDTLAFTNQLGITGSYNSGTGVLTLTGTTSVANYQTALRSVTYQNSSENPSTATRTVTFTVDDGATTGSATRGITITAVNDAPVNTVPGPQGTNQNTPLTFSSGSGNLVSIADVDAGANTVQVSLSATNGTLTLSGTSGLSFSFSDANGTGAGDGTADATMTFRGTIANINTALNGMVFTPTSGFTGAAILTITTNDLGNTGTGGPQTDTDTVNIQVATNITIQDAQVAEPSSGSVNMIFTVTLSAPAPAGGVQVNFTTQDIPPPTLTHATAGADYTTTSGTVNFAAGEQLKTIFVPVLSDAFGEQNETFEVVLSSPVNAIIADGTATGTILTMNTAGTILISELRTSGPGGAGDDFVEIYNNSNSPHTVSGTGGGYGLFKMGATCGATPILIGVIPNGTVIPARGHYLFVGSQYSLANYGGTGAAAGDQTLSSDIENDRNVAIFTTASLISISSANRLDAVGFGSNTGSNCDLLREGTTLLSTGLPTLEGSYQRDQCGKLANSAVFGACPTGGLPNDSNNNVQDFFWADTLGTSTPAGQHLGAAGPENNSSPLLRNAPLPALLVDATKAGSVEPNRGRSLPPVTNGANGTLTVRRRIRNDTGGNVTRLRFRIIDLSTFPTPGGIADMRALDSIDLVISGILDSQTCLAATGSATTPCTITVKGTVVETPPAQSNGGGTNSTYTVVLGTPLPNGASINVQWVLGVQTTGSFKFFFNVEALP
jgi:hypothetical protein